MLQALPPQEPGTSETVVGICTSTLQGSVPWRPRGILVSAGMAFGQGHHQQQEQAEPRGTKTKRGYQTATVSNRVPTICCLPVHTN